ncbi:MAG: YggS family pyridoxal phosphate-dependent enzyme [Chloroflexi bacterium]|nr:YggS family pyridoxal phosphate-dependent enzyme [Chloroflexota bacterium]
MTSELIVQNIALVRRRIAEAAERAQRSPEAITIVAASKTVPASAMVTAFREGIQHFGENRVQEALKKIPILSLLNPRPIWHMIGHLQSNKVKTAVQIFDIIQSVDSLPLAETISHRAQKHLPILLQVNISGEASKEGITTAAEAFKVAEAIARLPNLELRGLMTIAPLAHDPEEVRPIFRKLRLLAEAMGLKELSMGMTDDYAVAVEEGATIVRIGRAIFGQRRG